MQCSKAYGEWLKASKYKPKPIPLNQGLQCNVSYHNIIRLLFALFYLQSIFLVPFYLALKSSVSVTYINPTPWVPNIDSNGEKPSSQ